jgi:hypothetical protein
MSGHWLQVTGYWYWFSLELETWNLEPKTTSPPPPV